MIKQNQLQISNHKQNIVQPLSLYYHQEQNHQTENQITNSIKYSNSDGDLLLLKWAKSELQYLVNKGQIPSNDLKLFRSFEDIKDHTEMRQLWIDLGKSGFLLKMFQSLLINTHYSKQLQRLIDCFYHSHNNQLTLIQQMSIYWTVLKYYLKQQYQYNQKQLEAVLDSFSSQCIKNKGGIVQYVNYEKEIEEQIESSIISLIKLVFYLMVQKENNNKQKENLAHDMNQFQGQLTSYPISEGQIQIRDQQQLSDKQISTARSININTNCNEDSQDMMMSSQQQQEEELSEQQQQYQLQQQLQQQQQQHQQQQILIGSEFLARICQLQPTLQEYLVKVIKQVEEKLILKTQTNSLLERVQNEAIEGINKQDGYYYDQDQLSEQGISEQSYNQVQIQKAKKNSINHQAQINNNIHTNQQPLAFNDTNITNSTSDITQFRRIIFKHLQLLQQQNQQLRENILNIQQTNFKLQKEIEQHAQEQNKLNNKANQYTQQKQQLFQLLSNDYGVGINGLEDFVQIVKHLQQQNQLIQTTIAEIQERNFQLQKANAFKTHSINKSAIQITKVNQQITKYKTKIKGLKQDIEYLDQIVNSQQLENQDEYFLQDYILENNRNEISAQMIRSVNVDDENQFMFRKSIQGQLRRSVENVLRENKNLVNNQRVINITSENLSQKRSLTRRSNNPRISFQNRQKSLRKKNTSNQKVYVQNQENIQPSPFDQDEDCVYSDTENYTIQQSSRLDKSQHQEDEREIEVEKQKYRQQLVNSLQLLHKEIADLSGEVAAVKQSNKEYQKRNQFNEKKIQQLKSLHQAFFAQAFSL